MYVCMDHRGLRTSHTAASFNILAVSLLACRVTRVQSCALRQRRLKLSRREVVLALCMQHMSSCLSLPSRCQTHVWHRRQSIFWALCTPSILSNTCHHAYHCPANVRLMFDTKGNTCLWHSAAQVYCTESSMMHRWALANEHRVHDMAPDCL